MELVQARIVTDDVGGAAAFYAALLEVSVVINDYYVEIPAGAAGIGFSKRRFTEYETCDGPHSRCGQVVLDLQVADVDAEFARIDALGVDWVLPPTTQPWGNRVMVLRAPDGVLINVFSRPASGVDRQQTG
jgi:catechol 2,3-dioxygenase-like lactoylglutathione lyase family enzyme